jgi:hypothetical protein
VILQTNAQKFKSKTMKNGLAIEEKKELKRVITCAKQSTHLIQRLVLHFKIGCKINWKFHASFFLEMNKTKQIIKG